MLNWFIEDYGGSFGLKEHPHRVGRGVPEGTLEEWRELIQCIKDYSRFKLKRLAFDIDGYHPYIYSPKNSLPGDEFVVETDAAAKFLEDEFKRLGY